MRREPRAELLGPAGKKFGKVGLQGLVKKAIMDYFISRTGG